ncbi:unnamed protein product [marine sediment metagenome]|uniref:Uncharacterized protein n=1 Tax=marine sediment metagenome TaxID=412755 RepID=X0S4V9_9ZZZZ
MNKPILLKNWCVVPLNVDKYTPPELIGQALSGDVYGHPTRAEGEAIVTSQIRQAEGRLVTTNSGTVYELGDIDAEYLQWCIETEGVPVPSEAQPIIVHEKK